VIGDRLRLVERGVGLSLIAAGLVYLVLSFL